MSKNNTISEVLEDFDKKFCPNDIWDTKLITFELKDWLKRKLQQVSDRKVEEIIKEIEKQDIVKDKVGSFYDGYICFKDQILYYLKNK